MKESGSPEGSRKRMVSGETLDGWLFELVATEGTTGFVTWDGDRTQKATELDTPQGKALPFTPSNTLLAHRVVLFASEAAAYDSPEALFESIRSFIHRYADLSPEFENAAALYVLLSWVYDAFREIPYVRCLGAYGSGKTRSLQVIGSLCYKPMFASGASTVSPLFRIIDTFRGTLVLDEGDFRLSSETAELVKILNGGSAAGFPVLRSETSGAGKEFNPKAFVVYGPKVLATRNVFEDQALESRCITERMSGLPPRPDIPLTLPDSFEDEARAIRNQLLTYRFHNLARLREGQVPTLPGCEPRIAQVYGPLAAVAPTEEGRQQVLRIAQAASAKIRNERGATTEAQVVGVLHSLWKAGELLTVGAISDSFSREYGGDFQRPITARWVGHQLRSRLGLTPVKSHGQFLVSREDYPRLYQLFIRFMLGSPGDFGDIGDIEREAKQGE